MFGDYEVPDGTPVVLHDGARPFLQQDEIDRLLAAFRNPQVEVASLARPIPETLVVAGAIPGPITGTVDRELYFSIQTPQAARAGVLRSLMNEAPGDQFTDLLTWAEASGRKGWLVPSDARNIKVTVPADLQLAERWLESR